MFNTISSRQIQREYRKVLQQANDSSEPIIVMANNKPLGAIIGLELLEKFQLETALNKALIEYKTGKTKTISTIKELEADFDQMRKKQMLKDDKN